VELLMLTVPTHLNFASLAGFCLQVNNRLLCTSTCWLAAWRAFVW
jgi:hypothetical protein